MTLLCGRARTASLAAVVVAIALTGCGAAAPGTAPTHGKTPARSSGALDSMVVLGHSGTTGYNSDPAHPGEDAPANSWATGTNPQVRSLYQRLLVNHPALRGHARSLGVDGSTVDDLDSQVDAMLKLDPLPDLVVIQTIDNDLRCDGTDADNQVAFGTTLAGVLARVHREIPAAQVYFVDQWGSAATYAQVTRNLPKAVADASGSGPCDTFAADGSLRPAGVASLQRIVDGYFAAVTRACASSPPCSTDGGALQRMPLRREDLTSDYEHLSIAGQRLMADYAWRALPAQVKTGNGSS